MHLIFDSGLDTERSFEINDFYEDLSVENTSLNAVYHCDVNAQTVFQNYAGIASTEFSTVKIMNSDNVVIPQNYAYRQTEVDCRCQCCAGVYAAARSAVHGSDSARRHLRGDSVQLHRPR